MAATAPTEQIDSVTLSGQRRRSSSFPSTVATGRCSVSQANACGRSVKTSSCKLRTRLVGPVEPGVDNDSARLEVDLLDAGPHERQE